LWRWPLRRRRKPKGELAAETVAQEPEAEAPAEAEITPRDEAEDHPQG
jgi:hypothetical protein